MLRINASHNKQSARSSGLFWSYAYLVLQDGAALICCDSTEKYLFLYTYITEERDGELTLEVEVLLELPKTVGGSAR